MPILPPRGDCMSPGKVKCIGCDRIIDGKDRLRSEDPLRCVRCFLGGDEKIDWGRRL